MHIEEMFDKLDEDGGGTLSIEERTSLFKENGILMSEAEVADMFANAKRMHLVGIFKRDMMVGGITTVKTFELEPKDTDFNLKC